MAKQTTTAERTRSAPPQETPRDNLPTRGNDSQAPAKHPIVLFREYVEARMATLEEALPPHITPRKFVSVVMTALQTKPSLLKCTFPSLWNACVQAAHDGLLPNGREGAIAPFGLNEEGKAREEIATFMPMIEGLRKKIFETGKVNAWTVNVVYEKDEFEFQEGDNAFLRHRPYFGMENSGGVVGGYSVAKLANGEIVREVMTAFQINQIKNKSKAKNGPWSDAQAFPEMCKKTIARRHYKQLPHSESLDAIFARMDEQEGFADPDATPIPRPERRAISSRAMMDQYAGTTIDHDEDGVVQDDDPPRGATQADASKDKVISDDGDVTKNRGGVSQANTTAPKKEDAPTSAGASSDKSNTSGADASPGAAGEAGASTSTSTAQGGASASTNDADGFDTEADGADRPWPPGTKPTNAAEYRLYLIHNLAQCQKPGDAPAFWNRDDEKKLREECNCAPVYDELLKLAIARKKELEAK